MKVNTAGLFSLSHMASSHPDGEQPPPLPTDAPVDRCPRVRTTTLDRFNQEMSVLDQPLDGEVEFYDEPRPRRWRVPAIGVAIFALSCAGYLTAARYRHAPRLAGKEPTTSAAQVVAVIPSASAPAVSAPALTAAVPATQKSEAGTDKPAAPSRSLALADEEAKGHHHRHARHASGRHHGGHSHHLI